MLKKMALILVAPVFLTSCATTLKTHPDFQKRHEKLQNVSILPSNVEVYEVTFNAGNKPLPELLGYVDSKSSDALVDELKLKGYEITKVDQASVDSDPKIKEAWFNMQTLYKQALQDMAKNKKPKFTYDVGAWPNSFADKYQAHAIVLTRQVGTKLSQGAINAQLAQNIASVATSILVGVSAGGNAQPWFSLTTELAVVDADSGDILWYNVGLTTDNYTDQSKVKIIPDHIKALFKSFPDSKFKKAAPHQPEIADNTSDTTSNPSKSNFGPKTISPTVPTAA